MKSVHQNDIIRCVAAKGYYFERDAQAEKVTYFPVGIDNTYIMVSNNCLDEFVTNHPNGPGAATISERFGNASFLRDDPAFKNHLGKIEDYWKNLNT